MSPYQHFPHGVYTALITPFQQNDTIDWQALAGLIERQIAAQVAGLVVAGTTAEATSLTFAEWQQLVAFAIQCVKGRVPVIVGTGSPCTRMALEKQIDAEKQGADAALVVTPYYVKPNQEGLWAHYAYLNRHCRLPMFIYHIPGRTAAHITPELMQRLWQLEHVVGLKDCRPYTLAHAEEHLPAEHWQSWLPPYPHQRLWVGDDALAYTGCWSQAHGVISVAANLVPASMVNLVKLAHARAEQAILQQRELLALFELLFAEPNPAPIKAALAHLQYCKATLRLPMVPITDALQAQLIAVLGNIAELASTEPTLVD